MKLTEARKNRLQKKIDKYKSALKREKAKFGGYHDGGGYRYEIANLYFELRDYKKTNRYLNWFDRNFPDDVKYAYFDLGKSVTNFELKKLKESKIALININYHNTYLIDLILENDIEDQDKYEWIDSEGLNWAIDNLEYHLVLTSENYINWIKEYTGGELYQNWYKKLISIKKLLKGLDVGEERSNLLNAVSNCLDEWKSCI